MRFLLTTDTVGGVWTFTRELTDELLDRGHEVVLVSFGRAPSLEQQSAIHELGERGHFQFFASEVPLEWMPRNAHAYTAAQPMLLQLCRTFTPDALLLSQFCFGALPVTTPKIVIAHSDVLSWATAVGKAPLAEDDWLRTYRKLVQNGLNGADSLIAPTRAALETMVVHYRLPGRTGVVPNGRSLPHAVPNGRRVLRAVTAGRMWDPAKNLELFATVDSPVPILVAGENKKKTSGHGNGISLLGQQSERELLTLFRESAIYICCSLYEPFGLAPLEAALCGCAVLAMDIPTLREVWGEDALYFHDAVSLGLLLRTLADDGARLAEAQQHSVARAQRFSAARLADGYLQHIQDVIAAKAGDQCRAA